ncbi:MAG: ferritin [Clostridiales bacterium]|jgi:ferritin|nr:ferritin [Clostridiales bacterium]
MLNQEIADLLNRQLNREFFSAYLYLEIAGYYADQGLRGFEHWFTVQTQEERDHAMLFRTYILNNEKPVDLMSIPAPKQSFTGHKMPLMAALEHERSITSHIHEIYAKASSNKDFRTIQFLDWFVKEQGEEEKNTGDLIKRFELFGEDPKGLYLMDSELAARVYVAPDLVL